MPSAGRRTQGLHYRIRAVAGADQQDKICDIGWLLGVDSVEREDHEARSLLYIT